MTASLISVCPPDEDSADLPAGALKAVEESGDFGFGDVRFGGVGWDENAGEEPAGVCTEADDVVGVDVDGGGSQAARGALGA